MSALDAGGASTPESLRLQLVAAAAQLGLALQPADTNRLLDYLGQLQRWNSTYNLTAVREIDQMLVQHLSDCLAVLPPLQAWLGDRQGVRVLDVGSGAGLPGIVVAALLPSVQVTCVDAVGKKAAFVRQAAGTLGLRNLQALHQRVEQVPGPFQLVTSRAFASLPDFCRLTRHCLAPNGAWLALKGKVPDDEIAGLPGDVEVFHVEHLQVPGLDAERCLVWMRPRPG